MKILFINYEFPPLGGGAAHASLATARELVAMGHQVDFLTVETARSRAVAEIDGVRLHTVRSYRRGLHDASIAGSLHFLWAAARVLPRLARDENYDVLHYYFGLPTGLLTLVPGPHRSRPYVVSLRGSDVPGYDPKLAIHHRIMRPLTRRIWDQAHHVVANSEGLRGLALASFPDRRIDVIRNGVHPLVSTDERAIRTGSGLRILAVSRLIERKGLDVLLQAVARLGRADVSLEIAGDGPARGALEGLASRCGIAGQVRFLGFTESDELACRYRQADAFVLSSLSESCSVALLEAMAAGLPIIATNVGGTPELIEHQANGLLVRPGDVDELAEAIGVLRKDPGQRQRLGAAALESVQRRHSWRAVAERYEAVFREAAGSDRRAAAIHGVRTDDPASVLSREGG